MPTQTLPTQTLPTQTLPTQTLPTKTLPARTPPTRTPPAGRPDAARRAPAVGWALLVGVAVVASVVLTAGMAVLAWSGVRAAVDALRFPLWAPSIGAMTAVGVAVGGVIGLVVNRLTAWTPGRPGDGRGAGDA